MLNKAQIIGRMGKDPEVRYLPSGEAVANITLATSEKWKDKATGEQREETEWHRVSLFGRDAEVAGDYAKKGDLLYVEGKLKTRKYTDQSGSERYSTEIRCMFFRLLSKRNDNQQGHEQAPAQQRPAAQPQRQHAPAGSGFDDMTDDIPF